MKLRLTRNEFLARWRALRGFTPMRNDATITRNDGLDLDMLLETEMDAWYHRLLREADVSMLAPTDLTADVMLPPASDGCVTLSLPDSVVRVIRVKLSGWRAAARIVTDPWCNTALRQKHPYTRACADNPVAILSEDGSLSLYPASPSDVLLSLQCIVERSDEFALDSSALESIKSFHLDTHHHHEHRI